jgi:hypothetical protein
MLADRTYAGRLPALLPLALGYLQAHSAARVEGVELADHAVAVDIDLALGGLDEPEAAGPASAPAASDVRAVAFGPAAV